MASPPWLGRPAIWVTPWALSLREDAPMPNRGNTSQGGRPTTRAPIDVAQRQPRTTSA
jgi:hypothetical protein